MNMPKCRVGVVGATGYTGIELLKWLLQHPYIELAAVTARQWVGQSVAATLPVLKPLLQQKRQALCFVAPDSDQLADCDVVCFATPHGVAMQQVPALLDHGVRVIDLSADFRLKDVRLWQQWYQSPHSAESWLSRAVYGLTEWCYEALSSAQLVANPGCYPTAIQLALWPLLQADMIECSPIIVDAKSGVSGAGRQAKVDVLAAEMASNFKAYGAAEHRHQPEIVQGLQMSRAQAHLPAVEMQMTFVPHLLPIARGIESSTYVMLKPGYSQEDAVHALEQVYVNAAFVCILPLGEMPQLKWVLGTNQCVIGLSQPKGGSMLLISSVIDNLLKGAAGQAIQNLNAMMGWPETTGLMGCPSWP